ncbi:heme o synthase [Paenibacillus sp.]|uniref:heme o synthase n=1 Tax=Paenibacillus sp. TaxID=58172 RepID=UPI002D4F3DF8|nr:heme o synthase [Paenibacillus sp.]HZG84606.1 heme o synthase [Paenibacillus sp.]
MDKPLPYDASASRTEETAGSASRASWRDFFVLAKPRMIATNLITAFGGFWVASKWSIDWFLLFMMLVGSALIMGSGCVLNNVLDRERDRLMERTQKRAIPTGTISTRAAVLYAAVLGLFGLAVLYFFVNPLTALLGVIGHIAYVVIYTYWLKPTSTWSTSVGGIAGAVPPVIGYCAVSETVDMGAILLFGLLFFWQPPHFWALGIRKREEYRKAGYPLLPVVKGVLRTKWQMVPYLIALYPTTVLLYTMEYVGIVFLIGALLLLTAWTWQCVSGLFTKDDNAWALRAFKYSLYYLTFVFVLMIADTARLAA